MARSNGAAESEALAATASELLFILLPFVVIAVVLWSRDKLPEVTSRPDFPLAAALLFGQAVVKLISGAIKHGHARGPMVRLAVAAGIVFGLTPSLVVLVIDLLSATERGSSILHMILFGTALIYFVVFSWLGELAENISGGPSMAGRTNGGG